MMNKYFAIDQFGYIIDWVEAVYGYQAKLKFDVTLTPKERMKWLLNDREIKTEEEVKCQNKNI